MKKRINTEIIINASAETVWKILTDLAAYPEWNPFIIKIEGTLQKGNRLRNTLKNGNKTIVFKPIIQDVTPLVSFSWLGSLFVKGLFDGTHFFKIEPVTPNQVKLIHGEEFSGLLSTMILKKIGDDTRENFVRMNQALKERAER
ncbi:MAG: SRPBCC domain-containing protein [Chitinophagaceae bacterium]|nr:SRPBCC domain-containing protein [Chitinophagaceae bacterium]